MAGAAPQLAEGATSGLSRDCVRRGRVSLGLAPHAAGALVWLTFAILLSSAEAVKCDLCKDTISGCNGGATCPLATGPVANAAAMASSSTAEVPDFKHLLPPEMLCTFTRPILLTLNAVSKAPKAGGPVDLSSGAMAEATGVVKAAIDGMCTWEDSALELATRLAAASDEMDVHKINAAITLLKTVSDKAGTVAQGAVQSGVGMYTYIWAKIGTHMEARVAGTVRILARTVHPTTSDLTAKLRRPTTADEFYYMLMMFLRVVTALGTSFFLAQDFLLKTVFHAMQNVKVAWSVAHELLLIYFRVIETDTSGNVHLGNVTEQGSGDVHMAEARLNAETFFRGRGGIPRGGEGDGKKWNGKSSPDAKKYCVAFNFAREHTANVLDVDGCCRFAHKCNQWVSDKGPGGMCGGDHPKVECSYDPAKRLSAALK
jgi:hypothetical protein